jgi:hypothetical protein
MSADESVTVALPMGRVLISPGRYGETITVGSTDGGLLYEGFLYNINFTLAKQDDAWYPQAGCEVKGQACVIKAKVRDAIIFRVLESLNDVLKNQPYILQTLAEIKYVRRKSELVENLTRSAKYRENAQKEIDGYASELKKLTLTYDKERGNG